jgi:hypothetical protein
MIIKRMITEMNTSYSFSKNELDSSRNSIKADTAQERVAEDFLWGKARCRMLLLKIPIRALQVWISIWDIDLS